MGLKSKQGNVTCAFLHADIGPGENTYVDKYAPGFCSILESQYKEMSRIEEDSL